MPQDHLIVRGAREHNLKNVDISIPRDRLVVFTGLSGSGKSSLAFDTIFAEGQRRYVESLSAYARQFLGQMDKPDVDYIQGLSPAISIDQKSTSKNPRSTVGTVTEIHDYLRLLFARIGHPHCPNCGREIAQQSVEQIVDTVLGYPPGKRVMILAPVVRGRKGEHRNVLDDARRNGFVRVRADGNVYDLADEVTLDKNKKHDIEIVIDRLVIHDRSDQREEAREDMARLADSVEAALKAGAGLVIVAEIDGPDQLFSEHFACVVCGISVSEIRAANLFVQQPTWGMPSMHRLRLSPGVRSGPACAKCTAVARRREQYIHGRSRPTPSWLRCCMAFCRRHGINTSVPWADLSEEHQQLVLHGAGDERMRMSHSTKSGRVYEWDGRFEGVIPMANRRYRETDSEYMKQEWEQYMSSVPCQTCRGARLKPEALAVTVGSKDIVTISRLSIYNASHWFAQLSGEDADEVDTGVQQPHRLAAAGATSPNGFVPDYDGDLVPPPPLTSREMSIARQIVKEIRARLGFLVNVGLGYLTLERSATTLSGGEAQRIRLASQIGSGLMGALYVLDEPSIGLHQRDNARLLDTLVRLRDMGNTLIVVEHDEETTRAADYIVDIGPAAGEHGGHVVASGTLEDIIACRDSLTGQYLAGHRFVPVPTRRRRGSGKSVTIRGACENNLQNITVRLPLGTFICVTGVSGSGKSTLINEVLYKAVAQHVYRLRNERGSTRLSTASNTWTR